MSKNIAILTTTYLPVQGGIQYLLFWFLSEIDQNYDLYQKKFGFSNIYFIAPDLGNNKYSQFEHIKILEIPTTKTKFGKLMCTWKFLLLLKKYNISFLHSHNAYFDSLLCNFSNRLYGTKYMITSHGEDLAYIKEFGYGAKTSVRRIIKNNIKNSVLVTTISKDMCKFAYHYASREKVVLIPNFLPNNKDVFNQSLLNTEVNKIKKKYSLSVDSIVCLTLSGAREIKGHRNMLFGFKKAYDENKNLRLFIAAHGKGTASIKLTVESLKLKDIVYFVGFIKGVEKEAFFNISNIYVNTAYFEPFGLVYLEAITHKMANLASSAGGGKDIFKHKESAYLVDPYSIDSISDGIRYLCNQDERSRLIRNAQELLPKYNSTKVVKEYFNNYVKFI